MLNKLIFLFVILNFTSYLWSVIGIFKKMDNMDFKKYRILQILNVIVWNLSIYTILSFEISDLTSIVLAFIQSVCLIIFWSHQKIVKDNNFTIAFSKDSPKKLIKKGLFKYIRHPFYFTYILCYGSIALAYKNTFLLILSTLILYIYYRAAKFEEDKFDNSVLKEDYSKYKKETWMLFPKFF